MMQFDFSTTTLNSHAEGAVVQRILNAALSAVSPYEAVQSRLILTMDQLVIDDVEIDLNEIGRIFVVGAGKATFPMARAVFDILGERIDQGLIIVKDGHFDKELDLTPIEVCEASHPLPDERGVIATQRMMAMLEDVSENDLVLFLISGGGSALLTAPVEGISLEDMREMTEVMLASGATINEVNTLRKRLDRVKGGGIAKAVNHGRLMTLILSDVVGDPLDAIASGPTVADSSSFEDVREILEKYELTPMLPNSVLDQFLKGLAGDVEDTPFEDDQIFEKNTVHLVGNLKIAANAAKEQALAEGFHANIASTSYQGEAKIAGDRFVTVMREMSDRGIPLARPACLIFGGETTVTLRGDGKGGRNQEMALSAVKGMSGLKNCMLVTLATDGGDGPTDAAGAVVVPETLSRGEILGMDVSDYLANNDAYHYFEALGDLLRPGPTQTNVNDLAFLFCFENKNSL